jgi:hypothetical protein
MTIADVLAVLVGLIVLAVGFPALVTFLNLLFPSATSRIAERLVEHPVRSFAIGLVTTILLIVVASVSGNVLAGPGKLAGVIVLLSGLSMAALGATGLAVCIARRIEDRRSDIGAFRGLIAGAIVLEFSCALPVLGWFVVLPVTLLVALGAAVTGLLSPVRSPLATIPASDVAFDQ